MAGGPASCRPNRLARRSRRIDAPGGGSGTRQDPALIARATLPQLRHPDFARYGKALDDFYRDDGYAAQWFRDGARWRAGRAELAAAGSHGLDAADRAVDWLDAEAKAIAAGDRAPEAPPPPTSR